MSIIIDRYMKLKAWWKLGRFFDFTRLPVEALGSKSCHWYIPKGILDEHAVCYLAGAGEDISFDAALSQTYGCQVHTFDPTPRAIAHFEALQNALQEARALELPHEEGTFYPTDAALLNKWQFHPWGLWNQEEVLKFYMPADPSHVSHSAVNLQKTADFFEAQVYAVDDLMKQLGHQQIDLLKIDIEGAEYKVMEDLLKKEIYPRILCVEFDEVNHPQDEHYLKRIREHIQQWLDKGYQLVHMDEFFNSTLLRA
ncbi:FkbM family methyltransferase [Persicobacter diffluens]|uniref:Methyltransferase FkbM domain-containing protein n=1 Tax=Persicobacter diffluens TaxID=981 RepID=A0AAN4VVG1_9BACT|nr:hypothetical protein PEDI_01020 [Persicobacter diffluens]